MTWENHENQYLENLMKPTFGEFFEKPHKINCCSPGVQPELVSDRPTRPFRCLKKKPPREDALKKVLQVVDRLPKGPALS